MTANEALNLLNAIVADVPLTRVQHQRVVEAVKVLHEAIQKEEAPTK